MRLASLTQETSFALRHPELVWSNRQAGDAVWIRASLLRPRFHTVLDACCSFGIERVKSEWEVLTKEGLPETARATSAVTRMLHNIEVGYRNARAMG